MRAARQLKVTWDLPASLSGDAGLFDRMRAAKTTDTVISERGDVAASLASAAHVVAATYRAPYQAHAPFGPSCAVVDATSDPARVLCSSQSVYGTRDKIAAVLGVPAAKVRVEYYEGAGTFGRSGYDDAAQAAAIMSKEVGRPVRVQFMRADEHGWDNYGPPHLADVRAGVDAAGKIVGYEYQGWQHVWSTIETSQQLALGTPAAESADGTSRNLNKVTLGSMYDIPNIRLVNHRVPGVDGYLKASNLRSPLDLSFAFASEQTIDELARLAGIDPVEFRRRNIVDPRWLGVLDAVAQRSQVDAARGRSGRRLARRTSSPAAAWRSGPTSCRTARPSPRFASTRRPARSSRRTCTARSTPGSRSIPACVENQISGQLIQAASRMLKEEVQFTGTSVTSLDWNTYPILRFDEHPDVTTIVVQRPDERSTGAGEEIVAAAAAAIANAFFDATGKRLRQFPLTPARVMAALRG